MALTWNFMVRRQVQHWALARRLVREPQEAHMELSMMLISF